jgi:hypothetical protein
MPAERFLPGHRGQAAGDDRGKSQLWAGEFRGVYRSVEVRAKAIGDLFLNRDLDPNLLLQAAK